jgi:chromosome segregation ATPase
MSEEDTTPEVDEQDTLQEGDEPEVDSGKETQEFDADRAREAIRKKNQEAANLRKRLKELEPLAAKARELEDANKSETEKLVEDRDTHKSRADTAEVSLRKLTAALEAAPEGATLAQVRAVAKRLSGDTEEELAADAEELYELVGAKKTKVPGKPKENLRGGSDPDEPVEETDPRKLAAQIRARN